MLPIICWCLIFQQQKSRTGCTWRHLIQTTSLSVIQNFHSWTMDQMTESHNLSPLQISRNANFISWKHRTLIFHVHNFGYMITEATVSVQWSDVMCFDADEAPFMFCPSSLRSPGSDPLIQRGDRGKTVNTLARSSTCVMLCITSDNFRKALRMSTTFQ